MDYLNIYLKCSSEYSGRNYYSCMAVEYSTAVLHSMVVNFNTDKSHDLGSLISNALLPVFMGGIVQLNTIMIL